MSRSTGQKYQEVSVSSRRGRLARIEKIVDAHSHFLERMQAGRGCQFIQTDGSITIVGGGGGGGMVAPRPIDFSVKSLTISENGTTATVWIRGGYIWTGNWGGDVHPADEGHETPYGFPYITLADGEIEISESSFIYVLVTPGADNFWEDATAAFGATSEFIYQAENQIMRYLVHVKVNKDGGEITSVEVDRILSEGSIYV